MTLQQKIDKTLRDIPDYPKEGIIFKDLSTLLLKPELTNEIVEDIIASLPSKPDAIAAIESRGFWFGPLIANKLKVPFIPLRKKGKLPGETDSISYDLEYGSAVIEVHKGHIQNGWNIMIHDDLLATGGTAKAASTLIKNQGGKVHSYTFVVNLDFLGGKKLLETTDVFFYSSINY